MDVFRRVKGMNEKAIGHLAHGFGHFWSHRGEKDRRYTVRTRLGGEYRRHQGMGIELPLKIQARSALPAIPNCTDCFHHLLHARRRLGPFHAEAPLDMRTDLGSQAENKTPATEQLHIPTDIGEDHRVSRKSDRDRRDQLQSLGLLGRNRQGQEGIVPALEGKPAGVAHALQPLSRRAGLQGVLHQDRAVHLHVLLPHPSVYSLTMKQSPESIPRPEFGF